MSKIECHTFLMKKQFKSEKSDMAADKFSPMPNVCKHNFGVGFGTLQKNILFEKKNFYVQFLIKK